MTSSVFSLHDAASGFGASFEKEPQQHAACENCHVRKIKCIAGRGESKSSESCQPLKLTSIPGPSCQTCSGMGVKCRPRERNKMGRPRGIKQPSWRADVRPSWKRESRPETSIQNAPAENRSSSTSSSTKSPGQSLDNMVVDNTSPSHSSANSSGQSTNLRMDSLTSNSLSDLTMPSDFSVFAASHDLFPFDPSLDFNVDFDSQPSTSPTEDLELCDVHCRIRNAVRLYRSPDSASMDRAQQEDASLSMLMELAEVLHKLPLYRPMFLLGVAVLWDAVELANDLTNSLISAVSGSHSGSTSGSNSYSSLSLPSGPTMSMGTYSNHQMISPTDTQMNFGSSGLLSPGGSLGPSARNRHHTAIMGLTRLDLSLGDFAMFAKLFEDFAGESAPCMQMPVSHCRARISQLHDQINQCAQLTPSSWPGSSV